MRLMSIIAVAAAVCLGYEAMAGGDSESPPGTTGPVSVQDIDFQIKITKEAIEKYKAQAYVFDQKAQSLMPHDFMGYRGAENLSQQCQTIADDLTQHLSQLEQQRKVLEQHSSAPMPSERL